MPNKKNHQRNWIYIQSATAMLYLDVLLFVRISSHSSDAIVPYYNTDMPTWYSNQFLPYCSTRFRAILFQRSFWNYRSIDNGGGYLGGHEWSNLHQYVLQNREVGLILYRETFFANKIRIKTARIGLRCSQYINHNNFIAEQNKREHYWIVTNWNPPFYVRRSIMKLIHPRLATDTSLLWTAAVSAGNINT